MKFDDLNPDKTSGSLINSALSKLDKEVMDLLGNELTDLVGWRIDNILKKILKEQCESYKLHLTCDMFTPNMICQEK